ncbi:MAG: NAD(P)/FAD-dependent oxidoreductase [Aquamicrobium sp.]|uniref:NAD(P)/FAD-dependent oxidoreductase n=1 Tax=Aquamicrobium sp. TaxID=1872579 RepID=UPI00349E858A|nr:NAD(P)/FAD-dependent oxidoreductase [Aquamicrobium sp.]
MAHFDTVIVGAGHGGTAVADQLRRHKYEGTIGIVEAQPGLPYERPHLSKGALYAEGTRPKVPLRGDKWLRTRRVTLLGGAGVATVDAGERRLTLSCGMEIGYGKLVLATGVQPRQPSYSARVPMALGTPADARRVFDALRAIRSLAVVGGGFVGLEVASAAAARGIGVFIFEREDRLLKRALGADVSETIRRAHEGAGATVLLGSAVDDIVRLDDGGYRIVCGDRNVVVDEVLAGVGSVPLLPAFKGRTPRLDNGFVVTGRHGTTDVEGVYAVGDVARIVADDGAPLPYSPCIENALHSAEMAARHIAGSPAGGRAYVQILWTDQMGLKVRSAGSMAGAEAAAERIDLDGAGNAYVVICRDARNVVTGMESVNFPKVQTVGKRAVSEEWTVDRFIDQVINPDRDVANHPDKVS